MDNELSIVAKHAMHAPIDFDAVCNELGVRFCSRSLPSFQSGYIEREGDSFTIVVNNTESDVRQRFTAAHELAHYILHRDLMDHGGRMNRHTDSLFNGEHSEEGVFKKRHEVQANRMAAQIVMPAPVVRELVSQGLSPAEMAKRLRVSKAAMEIRLKTLNLTEVAIAA